MIATLTRRVFAPLAVVLLVGSLAQAVPAEAQEKKRELPKSGTLSATAGRGNVVEGVWGGVDLSGEQAPPVSGSVSRIDPNNFQMRAFNNSKDTYSLSLQVVQVDQRGNAVKRDSFSYTLKPNQSAERTVRSAPGAVDARLDVLRWKNLTEKQREAAKESEGETTAGQ